MASLMEDEVFRSFAKYAAIITTKLLLMGPVTAYYRLTRKAFQNPEDAAAHSSKPEDLKQLVRTNDDVERARRCHQNDLENIVPFVLIGFLYSLTGPDPAWALLHFRVFVCSRFIHTVAYLRALPQPSRGLSWIVGLLTTMSMAHSVVHSVVFH
ncbi:microsomal glutathione S-transferase 1 isoform X5 [Boleophthalmus pectinirostris]|nr:microsomal glutathione S-transferase 1 isoform X4 [Boleophthalmus pectinirostris]XP_055015918.1 microsomal glutathione S-transferase 1 isoform X4 [Boleophthalmus pectinirostris]XP_055015919.1 microsomal glutathione S-transferase 1 isoform X4 [Boleophthalmus pectinirostris]XP_055015920.1 microsomal glutathione S-transferase 1 isoform X4 [Boleophthalmus pectinirostris]XP_055015921.1 microsomal glutathione S-transferase 1 isoform X5 [Boleophthalmus pectinirostris]